MQHAHQTSCLLYIHICTMYVDVRLLSVLSVVSVWRMENRFAARKTDEKKNKIEKMCKKINRRSWCVRASNKWKVTKTKRTKWLCLALINFFSVFFFFFSFNFNTFEYIKILEADRRVTLAQCTSIGHIEYLRFDSRWPDKNWPSSRNGNRLLFFPWKKSKLTFFFSFQFSDFFHSSDRRPELTFCTHQYVAECK